MRHRDTFVEAIKGLGNGVRFLNYAMVWTKARLFDLSAAPYFWASLFQHIIITHIVYRLVVFWTQRRATAFLAALLFATTFSHYEVIAFVSASDYSFWAIFYLMTLALFAVYLERRSPIWYLGSVAAYAILAFGHDFTLNVPLILLAYHLTLGRGSRKIRDIGWADLRLHLPYWLIWGVHVAIQAFYVLTGSSEAVYSDQAYGPGLHMIRNLLFLVFLAVPNVHVPAINNFLTGYVGAGPVEMMWQLSVGLAIVGHVLAAILLWKGSNLVRFALALIYLPFLQYTLWRGDFAGAPRYLYLPSIGFSILVALLLIWLYDILRQKGGLVNRLVVPGVVAVLLLFNLVVIQVWVQRHIDNGRFRRPFVTQLGAAFQDVEPGSHIYIEVPTDKYTDLSGSCRLVLRQPVHCEAFVSGERSPEDVINGESEETVYWVEATTDGLVQVYPPSASR